MSKSMRTALAWTAMLVFTSVVLLYHRGSEDQSHVILTLLLVVLGGSVGGGRTLGFALALASTVVIDYFFQPPYGLLGVGKPLDWVVLLAFCSTAFVTSALLAGARAQAEAAEARTSEIETLSRLGTETLRHTSVEEALAHIVDLAQRAAQADACGIVSHDPPL